MIKFESKDYKLELEFINDICHDAIFSEGNINYNQIAQELTIKISREINELKQSKWFSFLKKEVATVMHTTITFRNVIDAELHIADIEDEIVEIIFNQENKLISIVCVRGSLIKFFIKSFLIELKDE